MISALSLAANLAGGSLQGGDGSFDGISIDTRTLVQGNIFFAIEGPSFDGHAFVAKAFEQGASACVVSRRIDASGPLILVADVTDALQSFAKKWRQRMQARVAAITGSNGKTTVKQMLASILSQSAAVLATRGNLNNHYGVPLTLAGLRPKHVFAVVEMGASAPGEIAALTRMAVPELGLVTNAGDAHLQGFGGRDGVAAGKGELFACLPSGGIAIINADDTYADLWRGLAAPRRIMSFSLQADADVRVQSQPGRAGDPAGSQRLGIEFQGRTSDALLPIPGRHNLLNAAAAAAAAFAFGLSADQVVAGLRGMRAAGGRTSVSATADAVRIVDDSYNANPDSMRAAIDLLVTMGEDSVLVIGDMAELGDQAIEHHEAIGRHASERGVARLYCLGPLSAHTAKAYGDRAQTFDDHAALSRELASALAPGAVVLVKGSRSARMERVVDALHERLGIKPEVEHAV